MIPYGRQEITKEDIDAVIEVLHSDFLTQGPVVPKFETAIANKVGAEHALALNSATSALHLACIALGLGAGDLFWTTPITFVASANCGLYCGAQVDFVDIDPLTYNISVEALEQKLIDAERTRNLPKLLIVVHLCGQSCDMEAIYALAQRYGFKIIEDASHAIGGKYKNEFIGSCKYSDVTIFSFHPVKIITTAEGGMVLTNNNNLFKKMKLLRSHGITRDPKEMTHMPDGPWFYQQIELGFNYRMTEIQAALGLSQLSRLEYYVTKRRELAGRYDQLLSDYPIVCPSQKPDVTSAYHLYIIRLRLDKIDKTHLQIFETLRSQDIGVNLHYIPIHMQPYYEKLGFRKGEFPEAEKYYSEAISLPMFPSMTRLQQDEVIKVLKGALVS